MHTAPSFRERVLFYGGLGGTAIATGCAAVLTGMWISERDSRSAENVVHAQEQAVLLDFFVRMSSQLRSAQEHTRTVETLLVAERGRNDSFQAQIHGIAGSVQYIQKTNATDEELLQKYSKVYFLNENYFPTRLTRIEGAYLLRSSDEEYIHAQAWPHLKSMLDAATQAGVPIRVVSAYRSFDEQKDLKSAYTVRYGAGANTFSADQGYSEHQLGTTADFTTPSLGATFSKFDTTDAFRWLSEHAHEFGFVLSYPKGNTFYIYEPWHWRFVGVALATKLHAEGKHFYDLDQREIDTFRSSFFD